MDQSATLHNLGIFRLEGFSGLRRELSALHEWLTGRDDLPAIAISGEQGAGKSTLCTAVAWNHCHHFSDGVVLVSPAGANPFRLYDVVRTFDTVLGTALTRTSSDRWGISILEQLYKRKRLLVIDKLAGATAAELATLVEIIGHLHENEGQSRIVLIDRNFNPAIANLVQHQHIHLTGLEAADLPEFIEKRAPVAVRPRAQRRIEGLFEATRGSPLSLRLTLGLLLDFPWEELRGIMRELDATTDAAYSLQLCAFAVENFALQNPPAAVLLSRLVRTVGGVSLTALHQLFWDDLGDAGDLQATLAGLEERGLIEIDRYRERAFMHPVVRRYLDENAVMLGEEWNRRHAAFYVSQAQQYQLLPLQRWPEVDLDWGNIFVGADWCAQRLTRLWEGDPLETIRQLPPDPSPAAVSSETQAAYDDLRLARDYALALADYAFWRHPPGIVRWLAVGALAALDMQDMRDYAWFLMNIGRQMFFMGRLQEAVAWFERARAIFDQRDLLAELAYVHTDLGTTYRVLDEPRQALDHFLAAFDCVAQMGDQHGLATAYMNLGSAHFSLNQQERALAEHRKALRIALRNNDSHLIASAHNNMGLALEAMERFDDARRTYEFALHMFRQTDDQTGVSACYNNLGSVAYARGDFAGALDWYELDMRLLQERGAWTDMAATLHNLGHVALEQGAPDRAASYFKQSRDLYAAFDLEDYVDEEEEMIRFVQDQKTRK